MDPLVLEITQKVVKNMTEFVKRGLPHIFSLQTSTIHNFGHVKAMDLLFTQSGAFIVVKVSGLHLN